MAALGALLSAAFAVHAGSRWARRLTSASLVIFAVTISFTSGRGAWVVLGIGLAAMFGVDPHRASVGRVVAGVFPVAAVAVWVASRAHGLTEPGRSTGAVHDGRVVAVATVGLASIAAIAPEMAAALGRRVSVRRTCSTTAAGGAVLVAVVGAIALLVFAGSRPDAATPTGSRDLFRADNGSVLTAGGRTETWRQAWRDFEDHPALGSGAGTFELYWLQHRTTPGNVRDAHSLYLEVLAELGPVGLLLLVAALGVPLLAVGRARFHAYGPGAFAAYLAFLLHAGVDWDWEMPAVTIVGLFCGAALLLAVRPTRRWVPTRSARGLAVAGTVTLALVALVGLAGNGALTESARAARSDHWHQSEAAARKATRWMPWSSAAWRQLALAQLQQGQLDAARSSLRTAVAKGPQEWPPWAALVRLTKGRTQRRALREAVRLNPLEPEVLQFRLAPGSLVPTWRYDDTWTGWPVAPLHRQHQIVSSFLDPRTGYLRHGGDPAYHFGIDIAVRDDRPESGAPAGRTHRVYAVEGGDANVPWHNPATLCSNRKVEIGHFDYWHVDTSGVVVDGQRVRPGQMIGWTCAGMWHVHLAETMDVFGSRVYVNPVHPHMKLQPFVDTQPPLIRAFGFYRPATVRWVAAPRLRLPLAGAGFPRTRGGRTLLSGLVDVRTRIEDRMGSNSASASVPPFMISIRVFRESDGHRLFKRTIFRSAVLLTATSATQAIPIGRHYAPGTKRAISARECATRHGGTCGGVYWFRLFARPTSAYWDTRTIANGDYQLRLKTWDAFGNAATATTRFTIRN
jgi:hypothetical protein